MFLQKRHVDVGKLGSAATDDESSDIGAAVEEPDKATLEKESTQCRGVGPREMRERSLCVHVARGSSTSASYDSRLGSETLKEHGKVAVR